MLTGTFTPSAKAAELSSAEHFNSPSTPVLVRFSNSTGLPTISDTDENADPRGIAIRFNLMEVNGRRQHTDVIAHSTPTFPTRTGAEFLEMLRALATSGPDVPSPKPIEKFLGANPKALVHVQWPKPPPLSFGTEQYWSVNAFKLIDASDNVTFIRYHIVPTAGVTTLDAATFAAQTTSYLRDELTARIAKGPIGFKILAQVAIEGDVTDDATIHWADSNPVVELGTINLDSLKTEEETLEIQKTAIFDPVPRIKGVAPSDDPLLEMRAALYLISGKQRRAA